MCWENAASIVKQSERQDLHLWLSVKIATAWVRNLASSNMTTGNFGALHFQSYNCFRGNNQYDLFTWCSSSSRIDFFAKINIILEIKTFKISNSAINRFEIFHPGCDLDCPCAPVPRSFVPKCINCPSKHV
jgi:hypothetical protein